MVIDARWEMYKIFLDEHPNYEKIFVSDTRDVIFQGDLFSKYAKRKNFLIYAAEADLIKNDPNNCNQSWIRHLFGEAEYQKLKDEFIICCGTVLGSRAEMLIFIEKMIELLKRSTLWGDEQAAMNYLVYNKILPIKNIIASDCNSGEILTAGLVKNPEISNEKMLRGDGGVPSVVHQYDRKLELSQLANKIYRDASFQPDENFTDVWSMTDQIICLVQRKNWSEATKCFINYVFYVENLTPYGEHLLRLYRFILKHYGVDAEVLISAVQQALVLAYFEDINADKMKKIYELFTMTEEKSCCVNPTFKKFVKSLIVTFIDYFYKKDEYDLGMEYIIKLSDWRD